MASQLDEFTEQKHHLSSAFIQTLNTIMETKLKFYAEKIIEDVMRDCFAELKHSITVNKKYETMSTDVILHTWLNDKEIKDG